MRIRVLSFLFFLIIIGTFMSGQTGSVEKSADSLKAEIMSVLNNPRWSGYYGFDEVEMGRMVWKRGEVMNCFSINKGIIRVETGNESVIVDLRPMNAKIWLEGVDVLHICGSYIQIFHKPDKERTGTDRKKIKSDNETHVRDLQHLLKLFLSYQKEIRKEFVAEDFSKFIAAVETCRQQGQLPTVTEEQRRYIVQANAANERKEYQTALSLYEQAMSVSLCSYPEAYYNMALIAAQTGYYSYAVSNMKKYLMLAPDAKDARAAQDKIYEWEYKMKK